MIRPGPGVAFTEASDGDQRGDPDARRRAAALLDVARGWATVSQVHGDLVCRVADPGPAGEGDAMVTSTTELALTVFTADCLGVVMTGRGGVAVAHAGWRGLVSGVLERTVEMMAAAGTQTDRAFIGPAIGPCCFEVGPEVAARFDSLATTSWGTTSVDLAAAARRRLTGIDVEIVGGCTMCGGEFSHRRDRRPMRMAALGWLP